MKLIIGLGNPGEKYVNTRHNIGFQVVDQCSTRLGIDLNLQKFKSVYGYKIIDGTKVFLLKPLTYMNLSGEAVRPFMDYFKIRIEDIVVVYDDLDLPPGKIRLRQKGGHGGHNGIKSLIAQLGTDKFKRIRVGIGRPPEGILVPNYVLGNFLEIEKPLVYEAITNSTDASEAWLKESFLKVMNQYN